MTCSYRVILLMLLSSSLAELHALSYHEDTNIFLVNQIELQFLPRVELYNELHDVEDCLFEINVIDNFEDIHLEYLSAKLVIELKVTRNLNFSGEFYSFLVKMIINEDILLRNFSLLLNYPGNVDCYKGMKAIKYASGYSNKDLVPYTDRMMQLAVAGRKVYILASNFTGVHGVEILDNHEIHFYDNRFHTGCWRDENIEMDWYPLTGGEELEFAFMIAANDLPCYSIDRYPDGKKAALCISSDADEENYRRLQAVYWGTSNENSSNFGTRGLMANNIRVCNTVFGSNFQEMQNLGSVWEALFMQSNSIGYHTYYPWADDMGLLEFSLTEELQDFQIRTWIDHSLWTNPEDLAREGWMKDSEYYIMDILRDNDFKYAWVCLNRENSFNSFEDFRQLPHSLPAMTGDYELFIFERIMGLTWQRTDHPEWGFDYIVNEFNLDNLLESNGLCHIYTHLCQTSNFERNAFYNENADSCWIKPDVENKFKLLNFYQENKGLWIETPEMIYDRLMAIDSVRIVDIYETEDKIHLDLSNESHSDIPDLGFTLGNQHITVDIFPAGEIRHFTVYNYIEENSVSFCRSIQNGGNLRFFAKEDKCFINQVKLYNIRGEFIAESDYTACGTDIVEIAVPDFHSGVYISRISLSHIDQFKQIIPVMEFIKTIYIK